MKFLKLYKNALILLVVLGLLVGAYFFISNKKSSSPSDATATTSETSETEKYMISVKPDNITSLSFNNEKGSFTLTKKDKTWERDPVSELPIDNTIADSSASDMSSITYEKLIEENAADLSKYGLDKPTTVKIGLSDGTAKELEVGSNTPTKDGLYAKLKGESKVYMISAYYESRLKLSGGHFVKKEILPVEASAIKKFSYEKNSELQYEISIESQDKMKITGPIKEEPDTTKVTAILQTVVKLAIKDIEEEKPDDLAKYGLDKPSYTIEYGDGTTTKKILFGKDVEKSSVAYAKFSDKKTVFTIDTTSLTFLDTKFGDVVNAFVYLPNISDVNKVELFIDGKTIVSDIKIAEKADASATDSKASSSSTAANSTKAEEDSFKVDGKDANMEDSKGKSLFKNFYQAIIGLTKSKYDPEAKPTGTPEVTIKYYMKPDSKPVTISLISKDSNYYYAMKDGVYTNKIILKSKLNESDGIRETYKQLKKAIDDTESKK